MGTKVYRYIILVLFVFYLIHLVFNLEKFILVNEIFTFSGIFLFLIDFKNYYKGKVDRVFFNFLLLLGYTSVYVLYSYFFRKDGNAYQFFRTLPLWYSMFAFFLGIHFFKLINSNIINRINNPFNRTLGFLGLFIGKKLSNSMIYPMTYGQSSIYTITVFIWLVMHMLAKWGGDGNSTSLMIIVGFIFYWILIRSEVLIKITFSKYFIFVIFGIGIFVLNFVFEEFKLFYEVGFLYFGVNSDTNLLWRLMYWAYEVNHNILNNPIFGIGFGKALFEFNDPYAGFIISATPDDDNLPYTHGTHNSFIYFLIRTGIVGFVLFISVISRLFKDFFKMGMHKSKKMKGYGFAFFIINISALFNVILESSLYAGIYWIAAGIMYGGIRHQKLSIQQKEM